MVDKKGLSKSGDIKDTFVLAYCTNTINNYVDRLNKQDISNWTIKDIVSFLSGADEDICFSDFARKYKFEMAQRGQARNARNYELAYQHLERYAGSDKIMFSRLTSTFIQGWIDSLSSTSRAKEMYPICVRQIFKAAVNQYNDYDRNILPIKTNPWGKIKIPSADKSEHKAIPAEDIKKFFDSPLPPTKLILPLPDIARDVAMLCMCLAGINTVDLYHLKKENYEDGILKYNRRKTTKFRADKSHLEIRVPDILKDIFDKYKTDDEYLFSFHNRYSNDDAFNANMNGGIRRICDFNNLPKYCIYTFRHSWGTIARNDIKASMYDVAFSMNHSSAHKITETYVRPDYSIVSELNQKVVDFVFYGKLPENSSGEKLDDEVNSQFKFTFRNMIMGTVFFNEKKIYSFKDIGYNNVDDVIAELVKHLPDDMPIGCKALFRIDNLDKGTFQFYERQKGKGF